MSIWRMRHGLSPFIERSIVLLVAAAGVLLIYVASLEPLVVATTAEIRNLPAAVTLDTDAWPRARNEAYGYQYGTPPGWIASDADLSKVLIARAPSLLKAFPDVRSVLVVEARKLGPRQEIENIAAEEFAGTRPALYDVGVDGHEALFAISFRKGRVDRQAVYVSRDGLALIFRGDGLDPSVFSSFVSTIRFFIP